MMEEKPWYRLWPEGVPKTIAYEEVSFFEILDKRAEERAGKPLIIYEDGSKLTYARVVEDSKKIATALWDAGLRKGDSVALVMFNAPEFVSLFFGALRIGAQVAIIDPLTVSEDLQEQLEQVKPKAILTDADVWGREGRTLEESAQHIIIVGKNYEEILNKFQPKVPEIAIEPRQDVATITFYAGIAGRTLATYHTHYAYSALAQAVSAFLQLKHDTFLLHIPLSHLFGLGELLITIYAGGTIVLMKRYDEKKVIDLINSYKIEHWWGPPMVFSELLKKGVKREDLASLKLCLTGAAPVPPELQKNFFDMGLPLVQAYGCTEALFVTLQPPGLKVYGSVGIPLPDVDVKIVDKETGTKELPIGEVGELVVRSPWIMKGYLDPEETSKAIRNGWLYTGDLMVMDGSGLLYFRGLKKRFLKYKAYPIFPRDLEVILLKHPAVKECRVDGEFDPEVGHLVFADVVLKPEYKGKVTPEELMDFVNRRVAFYKKLRKVRFVEGLLSRGQRAQER
jgi:long-chain acyl-CoA synthetase